MNPKLEVVLSPYTGYCFGVKRAMRLIDQGVSEQPDVKIYTLGEIIHNPQAVAHLRERGVEPVSSLEEIEKGSFLIIRAHGVQPELIDEAKRRGIQLLDATCPFVQKSQRYVRMLIKESYRVIIIGDADHPEVRSIAGHAGGNAIIIDNVDAAVKVPPMEKVGVVIQTTFSKENACDIIDILEKRIERLRVYDTICQATILRREATLELAGTVDVMLIVGGRTSSNTKRLYQMCIDKGITSHFVETADEIDPSWFRRCSRVGLTTGTSTPDWVVEQVLERMEEISLGDPGIDSQSEN
jgi:(E)-4-hydroxy-3-methyl-but-2-enyl pyrophosphate reductase